MLEHPVTPSCYHRFLSEDNTHTYTHTGHTKECMQAKRMLQHTKGMIPSTSLCGGKTAFTRTTNGFLTIRPDCIFLDGVELQQQ